MATVKNLCAQVPIDLHQRVCEEKDQAGHLNDYLCTLLAYERDSTAGIPQIFVPHSGKLEAACGSYAGAFRFLCESAGIPCISVRSSNHAWNLVYADGQWLYSSIR